jgi:hypothetical protein
VASRASRREIALSKGRWSTCRTGNSHGQHLTVDESSQALPDAPESAEHAESSSLDQARRTRCNPLRALRLPSVSSVIVRIGLFADRGDARKARYLQNNACCPRVDPVYFMNAEPTSAVIPSNRPVSR